MRRGNARRFRGLVVLLGTLFAAGPAGAQEVYGRVWVARGGGTSPAIGAKVTVTCGDVDVPEPAVADGNGAFRLAAAHTGPCNVQVQYADQPSSLIPIHVSAGRTRANLELTRHGAGWSLIRR